MTTPSGLPLAALQFWGAARGAVNDRASTAQFYAALNAAAGSFNLESHGLSFQTVNQLRSSAASVRNASERFARAPEGNAIDSTMIGVTPYARSLGAQADMPVFHVGIYLTTADSETGEQSTDYRILQFTGGLPATKAALLAAAQQDAEQLALDYGVDYVGHTVNEILAV
jgi:hypothetical protein